MSGLRIESITDVELYVVQHAEAVAGRNPNPDAPLTEAGAEQARAAGRNLAELGLRPDVVLTSPLRRAADTCSLALEAMNCPQRQIINDNLQEVSQDWHQNRVRGQRLLTWLTSPGFRGKSEHAVVLAFGHGLWTRLLADSIHTWPAEKIQTHPVPDTSLSLFTYGNAFGDPAKYWRTRYVGKIIEEFGVFNEFSSRQSTAVI